MTYRASIKSGKLLSAEEEIVLGRRVQDGIAAVARIESESLTTTQLRRLSAVKRAGIAARSEFVERNMRLAMNIAAKYAKAQPQIDYEDLIQESSIGLIRAVEKFDPSRGFKFSTYATWWCRQACQRAVANQSRSIRLPMHVEAEVRKLQRAMEKLESVSGVMPQSYEVADELGWDPQHCEDLIRYLDVTRVASLDDPISDDSTLRREDTVYDPTALLPDEEASNTVRASEVREAIAFLDDRERDILYMRHGVGPYKQPMSLQAIGDKKHLTRERIRQLEAKAISKLRHPSSGLVQAFSETAVL